MTRNISRGSSTDRTSKVGAMSENNIPSPDKKKQFLTYLLDEYVKNLPSTN